MFHASCATRLQPKGHVQDALSSLYSRTSPVRAGLSSLLCNNGWAELEFQPNFSVHECGDLLLQVYTAGGGAASDAWRITRQGLLDVPVEKSVQAEAAYGAALLALSGLQSGCEYLKAANVKSRELM